VGIELYEFLTQHFMELIDVLHAAGTLSNLHTVLNSRMGDRHGVNEEEYRPSGYPMLFLDSSLVADC
jgi:hypothetical protein